MQAIVNKRSPVNLLKKVLWQQRKILCVEIFSEASEAELKEEAFLKNLPIFRLKHNKHRSKIFTG